MYLAKPAIYQAQQIREIEQLAETQFHLADTVLMQRAGKAAFDFMQKRFASANKIVVMCGSGNNGGDGLVLAELAKSRGLDVSVLQVGSGQMSEQAQAALAACQAVGIPIAKFSNKADFNHPDLIVDALCGIGVRQTLREDYLHAVQEINRAHKPVFAIDLPSGIDVDTGAILGDAVRATATMTFIGLKIGLMTGASVSYTGELVLNDLQLPPELLLSVPPIAEKISLQAYQPYLSPRLRDWHKGLAGHVLIIGGAPGFAGAVQMAAIASLRVGAGLVSVATNPKHAATLSMCCPEIMAHAVDQPAELIPLMQKADVIVLGPGLSQTSWAKGLWQQAMSATVPMVVDADALNLLAENRRPPREDWVLTPHPGEAARLLNTSTQTIQEDRLLAVNALQQKYSGSCILKGAGTLVASANELPGLCDKGNPGMATAGMGDILSGVIGGLIAQGIPLPTATKLGVYIHASAGDFAAKDGERGTIATDLLPHLRRLVNSFSNGFSNGR